MLLNKNILETSRIERLVGEIGDDLRGKKRFAAESVPIAVAPYVTTPLPTAAELHVVECLNISRQGIAFLWPEKPPGRFMLIQLGQSPQAVYVTARVAGTTKLPGQSMLHVRCQFLREVEAPVA